MTKTGREGGINTNKKLIKRDAEAGSEKQNNDKVKKENT